jgi:hypothetical protein
VEGVSLREVEGNDRGIGDGEAGGEECFFGCGPDGDDGVVWDEIAQAVV